MKKLRDPSRKFLKVTCAEGGSGSILATVAVSSVPLHTRCPFVPPLRPFCPSPRTNARKPNQMIRRRRQEDLLEEELKEGQGISLRMIGACVCWIRHPFSSFFPSLSLSLGGAFFPRPLVVLPLRHRLARVLDAVGHTGRARKRAPRPRVSPPLSARDIFRTLLGREGGRRRSTEGAA